MIGELLGQRVKAKYAATGVNDAITCVGRMLEEDGLAKAEYTDAMIKQLETHGAYMVVCPGVALVHSRPEDGALGIGIALITLIKPLPFGNKENDPVSVVIGFSATTSEKHLQMIQLLCGLLMQDDFLSRVTCAGSSEELLAVLTELSMRNVEGDEFVG